MDISIKYQYYMDKKRWSFERGIAQGRIAMNCENKNSKSGLTLKDVNLLMHDICTTPRRASALT